MFINVNTYETSCYKTAHIIDKKKLKTARLLTKKKHFTRNTWMTRFDTEKNSPTNQPTNTERKENLKTHSLHQRFLANAMFNVCQNSSADQPFGSL